MFIRLHLHELEDLDAEDIANVLDFIASDIERAQAMGETPKDRYVIENITVEVRYE